MFFTRGFSAIVAALLIAGGTLSAADSARPVQDQTAQRRAFSIAYFNDIHGQLEPHPELFWDGNRDAQRVHRAGGLSRMATALKQLEAERPHGMLRIDGGDTFQGSGPGAWTQGEVMVRPLNALDLDVAVPGNWSVAYGADQLRHLATQLNYPLIAANMFDADTGARTFAPYLVREVNGVRIGLLGFTDPDVPSRQPPHMSAGLTFQATSVLQPLVDRLRNQEQVDVVILITHIGLHKAVPLAKQLRGVDFSLSSDTHERTYEPIEVEDTWVVEAGAFASLLGVLDVVVEDGQIVERQWKLHELREERFAEDPQVKQIVDEVLAPHRERMNHQIGHTDIWLERYNVMSTSMDRLIADAIKESAGTDIGLSNGYRFSPPTAPGPITEQDLWNWLPTVMPLKVGRAQGHQLAEYWESEFENVFSDDPERLYGGWLARPSTNMAVEFDSTAAAGERLRSLKVDGVPLDPSRWYSVAAGARKGQPEHQIHRLKQCRVDGIRSLSTHDAVRRYLASTKTIAQDSEPPLRCVVRPDILRSQFLNWLEQQRDAANEPLRRAQRPTPVK
ncbi:bifunctional metallophosphatase/5'-nucleotidase [Roseimaritima sediminicola]|uniref:bifunctional metallophosphatase/5'-nucleotidase n=1 Tax=Roseimaritima sediminicola TaxID=2662066 RepID=UPI0012984C9B|nr:5'-nucleotidase C-terminal domain-containing protein [Roseimaritima sediminicola]